MSVATAAEGLRGLLYQIKGLRDHIQKGRYRVRIGKKSITMDTLKKGMNDPIAMDTEVRITPVVAGAKNGGLFQIVLGAALIATAFITGGASMAAWGGLSTGLFSAGLGMALGGVSQLLTKTPTTTTSSSADNGTANNYFSSLENVVGQGQPVPLLYGRMRVGSHVISQGINTDITD